MKKINRRDFLKWGTAGTAGLIAASKLSAPWLGEGKAGAATIHTFDFTITDAIKEMHTHIPRNNATCYFWLYRWDRWNGGLAPQPSVEVPGPSIYVTEGDTITFNITNRLDEPHTLSIPALGFDNRANPVPVNGQKTYTFIVPGNTAGAYLYYDNLSLVNRCMGLHGAIVVMPSGSYASPFNIYAPTQTQYWDRYPYSSPIMNANPNCKALFDSCGGPNNGVNPFPGLAWHEGAGTPGNPMMGEPSSPDYTLPFRRYIWLMHQASPVLFEEVGRSRPGAAIRQPANFARAMMADPFLPTSNDGRANTKKLDRFNRKPQFFTFNGQSGHFSHNNATITPMHRVGEVTIISVMNAGLMTHSQHLHANHFYLLAVGSVDQAVAVTDFYRDGTDAHHHADNPIWLDVYQVHPMTRQDWLVPFMRCPDVGNIRGIGLADTPLNATANPSFPGFRDAAEHPVWPPTDEFTMHHPALGTMRKNFDNTGTVDIAVSQSPLCYPSHDHSEPSQTSQGGNYNTGLIAGMYFIGDRLIPEWLNFPIDEADGDDFKMMLDMAVGTIGVTGPAAGPEPA